MYRVYSMEAAKHAERRLRERELKDQEANNSSGGGQHSNHNLSHLSFSRTNSNSSEGNVHLHNHNHNHNGHNNIHSIADSISQLSESASNNNTHSCSSSRRNSDQENLPPMASLPHGKPSNSIPITGISRTHVDPLSHTYESIDSFQSPNDIMAEMMGSLHLEHLKFVREDDNSFKCLGELLDMYEDEQVEGERSETLNTAQASRFPCNYLLSTLNELITTESAYVSSLQTLRDQVLIPLKVSGKKIISEQDYQLLTSNVDEIIGVHETLLEGLNERFITHPYPAIPPVGDIYLCLLPFLRTYITYISNYPTVIDLVGYLRENNEKFQSLVETAERSEEFRGLKLESYLIMPVQRVPRYRLLLENVQKGIKKVILEYIKSVPETSPLREEFNDRDDINLGEWVGKGDVFVTNEEGIDVTLEEPEIIRIRDCVEKVKDIAHGINESVRQHEATLKVLQIQESLGSSIPSSFQLIQPNRKFIAEFSVFKVSRTGFDRRQLLLFNDVLLVTKPTGSSISRSKMNGKRESLEKVDFKMAIDLVFAWIKEDPKKTLGRKSSLTQSSVASSLASESSDFSEADDKLSKKYPVHIFMTTNDGDKTLTFFLVGENERNKFIDLLSKSIFKVRGTSAFVGGHSNMRRGGSFLSPASRRCSQQASPPVVSYHSTSSLAIPVKPPRRGSSDSNKADEGQIASRIRLQSQLLQKFDIRVPDHYLTDSSNPSSIASSPANSYSESFQSEPDFFSLRYMSPEDNQYRYYLQKNAQRTKAVAEAVTSSLHSKSKAEDYANEWRTRDSRYHAKSYLSPVSLDLLDYSRYPKRSQSQTHSYRRGQSPHGSLLSESKKEIPESREPL